MGQSTSYPFLKTEHTPLTPLDQEFQQYFLKFDISTIHKISHDDVCHFLLNNADPNVIISHPKLLPMLVRSNRFDVIKILLRFSTNPDVMTQIITSSFLVTEYIPEIGKERLWVLYCILRAHGCDIRNHFIKLLLDPTSDAFIPLMKGYAYIDFVPVQPRYPSIIACVLNETSAECIELLTSPLYGPILQTDQCSFGEIDDRYRLGRSVKSFRQLSRVLENPRQFLLSGIYLVPNDQFLLDGGDPPHIPHGGLQPTGPAGKAALNLRLLASTLSKNYNAIAEKRRAAVRARSERLGGTTQKPHERRRPSITHSRTSHDVQHRNTSGDGIGPSLSTPTPLHPISETVNTHDTHDTDHDGTMQSTPSTTSTQDEYATLEHGPTTTTTTTTATGATDSHLNDKSTDNLNGNPNSNGNGGDDDTHPHGAGQHKAGETSTSDTIPSVTDIEQPSTAAGGTFPAFSLLQKFRRQNRPHHRGLQQHQQQQQQPAEGGHLQSQSVSSPPPPPQSLGLWKRHRQRKQLISHQGPPHHSSLSSPNEKNLPPGQLTGSIPTPVGTAGPASPPVPSRAPSTSASTSPPPPSSVPSYPSYSIPWHRIDTVIGKYGLFWFLLEHHLSLYPLRGFSNLVFERDPLSAHAGSGALPMSAQFIDGITSMAPQINHTTLILPSIDDDLYMLLRDVFEVITPHAPETPPMEPSRDHTAVTTTATATATVAQQRDDVRVQPQSMAATGESPSNQRHSVGEVPVPNQLGTPSTAHPATPSLARGELNTPSSLEVNELHHLHHQSSHQDQPSPGVLHPPVSYSPAPGSIQTGQDIHGQRTADALTTPSSPRGEPSPPPPSPPSVCRIHEDYKLHPLMYAVSIQLHPIYLYSLISLTDHQINYRNKTGQTILMYFLQCLPFAPSIFPPPEAVTPLLSPHQHAVVSHHPQSHVKHHRFSIDSTMGTDRALMMQSRSSYHHGSFSFMSPTSPSTTTAIRSQSRHLHELLMMAYPYQEHSLYHSSSYYQPPFLSEYRNRNRPSFNRSRGHSSSSLYDGGDDSAVQNTTYQPMMMQPMYWTRDMLLYLCIDKLLSHPQIDVDAVDDYGHNVLYYLLLSEPCEYTLLIFKKLLYISRDIRHFIAVPLSRQYLHVNPIPKVTPLLGIAHILAKAGLGTGAIYQNNPFLNHPDTMVPTLASALGQAPAVTSVGFGPRGLLMKQHDAMYDGEDEPMTLNQRKARRTQAAALTSGTGAISTVPAPTAGVSGIPGAPPASTMSPLLTNNHPTSSPAMERPPGVNTTTREPASEFSVDGRHYCQDLIEYYILSNGFDKLAPCVLAPIRASYSSQHPLFNGIPLAFYREQRKRNTNRPTRHRRYTQTLSFRQSSRGTVATEPSHTYISPLTSPHHLISDSMPQLDGTTSSPLSSSLRHRYIYNFDMIYLILLLTEILKRFPDLQLHLDPKMGFFHSIFSQLPGELYAKVHRNILRVVICHPVPFATNIAHIIVTPLMLECLESYASFLHESGFAYRMTTKLRQKPSPAQGPQGGRGTSGAGMSNPPSSHAVIPPTTTNLEVNLKQQMIFDDYQEALKLRIHPILLQSFIHLFSSPIALGLSSTSDLPCVGATTDHDTSECPLRVNNSPRSSAQLDIGSTSNHHHPQSQSWWSHRCISPPIQTHQSHYALRIQSTRMFTSLFHIVDHSLPYLPSYLPILFRFGLHPQDISLRDVLSSSISTIDVLHLVQEICQHGGLLLAALEPHHATLRNLVMSIGRFEQRQFASSSPSHDTLASTDGIAGMNEPCECVTSQLAAPVISHTSSSATQSPNGPNGEPSPLCTSQNASRSVFYSGFGSLSHITTSPVLLQPSSIHPAAGLSFQNSANSSIIQLSSHYMSYRESGVVEVNLMEVDSHIDHVLNTTLGIPPFLCSQDAISPLDQVNNRGTTASDAPCNDQLSQQQGKQETSGKYNGHGHTGRHQGSPLSSSFLPYLAEPTVEGVIATPTIGGLMAENTIQPISSQSPHLNKLFLTQQPHTPIQTIMMARFLFTLALPVNTVQSVGQVIQHYCNNIRIIIYLYLNMLHHHDLNGQFNAYNATVDMIFPRHLCHFNPHPTLAPVDQDGNGRNQCSSGSGNSGDSLPPTPLLHPRKNQLVQNTKGLWCYMNDIYYNWLAIKEFMQCVWDTKVNGSPLSDASSPSSASEERSRSPPHDEWSYETYPMTYNMLYNWYTQIYAGNTLRYDLMGFFSPSPPSHAAADHIPGQQSLGSPSDIGNADDSTSLQPEDHLAPHMIKFPLVLLTCKQFLTFYFDVLPTLDSLDDLISICGHNVDYQWINQELSWCHTTRIDVEADVDAGSPGATTRNEGGQISSSSLLHEDHSETQGYEQTYPTLQSSLSSSSPSSSSLAYSGLSTNGLSDLLLSPQHSFNLSGGALGGSGGGYSLLFLLMNYTIPSVDDIMTLLFHDQPYSVSSSTNEYGETVLMHAIARGVPPNALLMMFNFYDDINHQDCRGQTVIVYMIATRLYTRHADLFHHIMEMYQHQIDFTICDHAGNSYLHHLYMYGAPYHIINLFLTMPLMVKNTPEELSYGLPIQPAESDSYLEEYLDDDWGSSTPYLQYNDQPQSPSFERLDLRTASHGQDKLNSGDISIDNEITHLEVPSLQQHHSIPGYTPYTTGGDPLASTHPPACEERQLPLSYFTINRFGHSIVYYAYLNSITLTNAIIRKIPTISSYDVAMLIHQCDRSGLPRQHFALFFRLFTTSAVQLIPTPVPLTHLLSAQFGDPQLHPQHGKGSQTVHGHPSAPQHANASAITTTFLLPHDGYRNGLTVSESSQPPRITSPCRHDPRTMSVYSVSANGFHPRYISTNLYDVAYTPDNLNKRAARILSRIIFSLDLDQVLHNSHAIQQEQLLNLYLIRAFLHLGISVYDLVIPRPVFQLHSPYPSDHGLFLIYYLFSLNERYHYHLQISLLTRNLGDGGGSAYTAERSTVPSAASSQDSMPQHESIHDQQSDHNPHVSDHPHGASTPHGSNGLNQTTHTAFQRGRHHQNPSSAESSPSPMMAQFDHLLDSITLMYNNIEPIDYSEHILPNTLLSIPFRVSTYDDKKLTKKQLRALHKRQVNLQKHHKAATAEAVVAAVSSPSSFDISYYERILHLLFSFHFDINTTCHFIRTQGKHFHEFKYFSIVTYVLHQASINPIIGLRHLMFILQYRPNLNLHLLYMAISSADVQDVQRQPRSEGGISSAAGAVPCEVSHPQDNICTIHRIGHNSNDDSDKLWPPESFLLPLDYYHRHHHHRHHGMTRNSQSGNIMKHLTGYIIQPLPSAYPFQPHNYMMSFYHAHHPLLLHSTNNCVPNHQPVITLASSSHSGGGSQQMHVYPIISSPCIQHIKSPMSLMLYAMLLNVSPLVVQILLNHGGYPYVFLVHPLNTSGYRHVRIWEQYDEYMQSTFFIMRPTRFPYAREYYHLLRDAQKQLSFESTPTISPLTESGQDVGDRHHCHNPRS